MSEDKNLEAASKDADHNKSKAEDQKEDRGGGISINPEFTERFNSLYAKQVQMKGVTQVEFANKVGVSQPSVYKYLHGKAVPKRLVGTRIADYFGVTYEELMGEDPVDKRLNISNASTSEKLNAILSRVKNQDILRITKSVIQDVRGLENEIDDLQFRLNESFNYTQKMSKIIIERFGEGELGNPSERVK